MARKTGVDRGTSRRAPKMMGEAHDAHDDAPASRCARTPLHRTGAELVAPITLGRPGWRCRYTRFTRAIDATALASAPLLFLLWRAIVAVPLVAVVLSVVAVAVAGRAALHAWLHHLRRHGRAMSS